MPIYEEKLICPLSLRFTQEHIRSAFRDGRPVQATIDEIKVEPGTGDYDLIIAAPFPNIEVVRWYQKAPDGTEPDADHWFTLDNRRLYCLQRVAAAHWPKRCAAVVELLRHAPNSTRHKDDSETAGREVRIGTNSSAQATTAHWSWRKACGAVRCLAGHRVEQDHDLEPWACDFCRKVMPTRQRFRCLQCDFDLCATCHEAAPRTLTGVASDDTEVSAVMCVMADDKRTTASELVDAPAREPTLLAMAAGMVPLEPMALPASVCRDDDAEVAPSEDSTHAAESGLSLERPSPAPSEASSPQLLEAKECVASSHCRSAGEKPLEPEGSSSEVDAAAAARGNERSRARGRRRPKF